MQYKYCPLCRCGLIEKEIDSKIRGCCINSECDFVLWNNPVPVVAAIVEHEGKVMLARNSEWDEGKFALIAGYLEEGETPETAVIRELKEETNLTGEIISFCGHYNFKDKNQLFIVYHLNATGIIKLNHEIAEIKYFTKDQIKRGDVDTGPALADWLAKNN